jgi:hypothetical protein
MGFFNGATDGYAVVNAAVGTYPFVLRGGLYQLEYLATGSGTADVKKLSADGSTWTARVTQVTATSAFVQYTLPPGNYEFVITGFTANYLSLTRIPTYTE